MIGGAQTYSWVLLTCNEAVRGDMELEKLQGDKEDPGNYRGIPLLSVVGKVFCKVLNERLVKYLDRGQVLHEGQAGFRVKPAGVVLITYFQ